MSTTGITWDDESAIEEHEREQRKELRAESIQRVQHASTKSWLESKLDEQAKPVPIFDREFLFRPIGSAVAEEIMELASKELPSDAESLDDVDPEDMQDMPEMLRRMRETLAEHCLDDEMGAAAFGRLPLDMLEELFEEVAAGGDLSPQERERVDQFRGR